MGAPGLFDCDLMGVLADMNAGGVDESSEDEGKVHAGRWSLSELGNEVKGYASSPLPSTDVAQVFSPLSAHAFPLGTATGWGMPDGWVM